MTGSGDLKAKDLGQDTKDYHDEKHRITSDYGVKQSNTDDWLKVSSEENQGPMLLEDSFAREKVNLSKTQYRVARPDSDIIDT
jgi:catalase